LAEAGSGVVLLVQLIQTPLARPGVNAHSTQLAIAGLARFI